jgi:tripartite-type tricarboxylate transporter receptor subunit TctC
VLAVKADSPFKTLKDLIEAAKKNPGKLTYSTTGVYSTLHIPVEMFTQSAGIKMTHVPCPGSAPATAALLGGHVDATSSSMASITPHLKAGSLRALTVFQTERLKDFPDVPSISELGYTGRFFSFQGLAAPKGTPDEVIRTVSGAVKKITEDHKDYVEGRLEPISLKMAYLDPEEFLKSLKEDREAMTKIYENMKKTNP